MDTPVPVLPTKIFVPRRRSDLLTRPRLIHALHELLDYKLIIIAAPAGYGKTSLVVDFAHHTEWPFCWYSLDALDGEPIRFLSHFISSITMQFPLFGKRSRSALHSMAQGELNLDTMLAAVIQDAFEAINEHFVIVLDDYHFVDKSEPIAYFISRLIQDSDENCHIILTSRMLVSLPELPLMVARSQVGGLGAEDLAFTAQEIQILFQQNLHQAIPESLAQELARLSEGWITGLLLSSQMADLGVTERLRRGRIAAVGLYDYLASQVLDRQPAEVRDFLLRTSLPDEFNAEECAAVLGAALGCEVNWNALIEHVLQANLFITPVGESEVWYRYHHLFADFLRQRMLRERPEESQRIIDRLTQRYREQRAWDRIYTLYHRLERLPQTASLLEEIGSELMADGRLTTLEGWLDALPEDEIERSPILLSLQGGLLMMRGEMHRSLELLDRALPMLSPEEHRFHYADALIRRSTILRALGEHDQALRDVEQAIELTSRNPRLAELRGVALHRKGVTLYYSGLLNEALGAFNEALEAFADLASAQQRYSAYVLMDMGAVYVSLGNFVQAERSLMNAIECWLSSGNIVRLANAYNNLGDLQRQMGNYESALSSLQKSVEYARQSGYPRMEAYALASIGDLYRDLGAYVAAQEAYQQALVIMGRVQDHFLEVYLSLAQAVLASVQGNMDRARNWLAQAQRLSRDGGSAYEQHLCYLEAGRIDLLSGNIQAARETLQRALSFFASEGHSSEAQRAELYYLFSRIDASLEEATRTEALRVLSRFLGREIPMAVLCVLREMRSHLEMLACDPGISLPVRTLLQQVDHFEQQTYTLRKRLRREAVIVPFAGPQLVIHALGRIQVRLNDRPLEIGDWQTQSARDLFLFLLSRPEGVTREAIGAIFWPEASTHEVYLRFKNTLYRLRRAVGKDVVLFHDGYYQFNANLDYEYDVEQFFREIYHAERSTDVTQKIAAYQNALRYYQGPYLPGLDDAWVVIERQRLFQAYTEALLKLGSLYLEQGDARGALNCAQQLLQEDPCFEEAHRLAMQAYAAMGNRAAVVRQYDYCRRVLSEELNTTPSAATRSLYEALTR